MTTEGSNIIDFQQYNSASHWSLVTAILVVLIVLLLMRVSCYSYPVLQGCVFPRVYCFPHTNPYNDACFPAHKATIW